MQDIRSRVMTEWTTQLVVHQILWTDEKVFQVDIVLPFQFLSLQLPIFCFSI